MLKKFLFLCFSALVVLSMSACSEKANETENKEITQNGNSFEAPILKSDTAPDAVSEDKTKFEYSKKKGVITEYPSVSERKEVILEYADEAYMAELDAKSEALKQSIINSKDEIDLTGKTVYYISNDGDDENNNGKSPESPFETVYRTEEIVKEGDIVLFRRGDLFRGNFKAQPGVTYAAYGEGEKPKLYASKYHGADPDLWTLFDSQNNIWMYNRKMMDIGAVIINDGEYVGYKEIPTWNSAEKKFVLRDDGSVDFLISTELDNDLDFFCDATSVVKAVPQVSKVENIGYLYMKCDRGNPGEIFDSIEFNPRVSGISIGGDNVTIDNLCIKHSGVHGIASGTVNNLTVTNCEIGWIGGGIQYYDEISGRVTRLGNGVEIYGGCHGYVVDNCYIYQCYDAGVTHQVRGENKYYEMFDIYYTNNLFEYNTYSVEYFLSRLEAGNKSKMKNVNILDNIMRYSGYGWGEQRPDKGSAAHIKSWCHSNAAEDFIIENNIFDRALHRIHHTGAWNPESVPKLKNNTYIQNYGMNFGVYALVTGVDIPFDYRIVDKFKIGGELYEEGAKVLFVKQDDIEFEMPAPTYSEYIDFSKSYSYTTEDGYTLPFRMIMPEDYDKSKNYPVILYLGSEYQRGNDNVKQVKLTSEFQESVYNTWISDNVNPINAIILAPQCPKSERLTAKELSYAKNYTSDIEETAYLKAVAELLPKACEYFGGNSENVSVIGYSTGGTAAIEFAVKHPEYVKSVAAIACFGYTGKDISVLSGKDIFICHGARDKEIPVENARELVKALQDAGAIVEYKEYERETHDVWGMVLGHSLAVKLTD